MPNRLRVRTRRFLREQAGRLSRANGERVRYSAAIVDSRRGDRILHPHVWQLLTVKKTVLPAASEEIPPACKLRLWGSAVVSSKKWEESKRFNIGDSTWVIVDDELVT